MKSFSSWEQLKFVTGNANKVREASEILGVRLQQVEVEGLYETQTRDLAELVSHKARQAYESLQSPVLVEDSGLVFSAWNGLPGALVKWFESTVGCEGMLKMLESFDDRKALALCYVAVYDGESLTIAKGEVEGRVADCVHGDNGFGWDVLFIPDGEKRTYAEMEAHEKNAISHRKRAFEELRRMLSESG